MSFAKILAAGAFFIAAPAMASTTITFDTYPAGTTVPIMTAISNQYASQGVTFSGTNSTTSTGAVTATDYSAGSANAAYARNYLANYSLPTSYGLSLLAPRYNVVTATFSTLVSDVSFGLNTFGTGNSITVNAFGAAGNLLQSLVLSANDGWSLKSLTAAGIARIDFAAETYTGSTTIKIFGIDNLTYTQQAVAAVPEPATWGMMILGFGLMGGALRSRNTKVAFA